MKLFNLNSILSSRSEYDVVREELKSQILNDFDSIKKNVLVSINGKEIEMTTGRLMTNLLFMRFFVYFDLPFTEDDLFNNEDITSKSSGAYFNKLLDKVKETNSDYDLYREAVAETLNELNYFSSKLNSSAGNSISLLDILKMDDDEDGHEILFPNFDNVNTFDEYEEKFKESSNKIEQYYKNHPERELNSFIRAGAGINMKQLTQSLSFAGMKPTIDGTVIPYVVESNYVVGLESIDDWYVSCKGARLAMIINKMNVSRSGYLARKLLLLLMDTYVDSSVEDCGTKHTVSYNVSNGKMLNQIEGRIYYDYKEDGAIDYSKPKTVRSNDAFLIGRKIPLRSPICCSLPNHKKCKYCYGKELAEINDSLNQGIIAGTLFSSPVTQLMLSAKHLLSTNTVKVEWGDEFLKVFDVNTDTITFAENVNAEFEIEKPKEEDFDDENDAYVVNKLKLYIDESKKPIEYVSPEPLFINKKLVNTKSSEIRIKPNQIKDDDFVFKFIVRNNEITKSLQNNIDIMESSSHLGITNYNDLVNRFNEILIENGLDGQITSIHIEMIISELLSDIKGNKIDWSQDTIPEYRINRVSRSIMDAPISRSLSFERILEQLSNINTYDKDEYSIMDSLFQ